MNGHISIIVLAVVAIHSEALVAPPCIKPQHYWDGTSQKLAYPNRASSRRIFYHAQHQQFDRMRFRTALSSSVATANGDKDYESPVNEFQPRTMTVSGSFTFFARFLVQTILEKRAQRNLGQKNRRRLRSRLKRVLSLRKSKTELITNKKKPKAGRRFESINKLNESRKKLIELVGYDSSLMVPSFSFLVMGAFMSSVIPHFYSSCISCVAAGEPNQGKLLWAVGGLGISYVLEALFTGFRGALFWVAGER
mmetsp:Transcript_30514/g.64824  ORF Transcript_30514/g.64824 Transcript_30514/m.64824 type:complete len:251 (-) Transcript_30514:1470-2222(-)